tara:strand:+ start:307 stop:816 length:510 start_codon:yes stop_codon:yes gene_type:complete
MLSKFNNNFIYLTLEDFCENCPIKIKHVRSNIKFWNKWLGINEFDIEFLKETFADYNNKIYICCDSNKDIQSIAIYNNYQDLFYNLILLAKKHNSNYKWLGKKILRELNKKLINNKNNIRFIVLTDVSDIPNYYKRLGFSLTNNKYLRKLLDNFEDDLYVIEIESENFI